VPGGLTLACGLPELTCWPPARVREEEARKALQLTGPAAENAGPAACPFFKLLAAPAYAPDGQPSTLALALTQLRRHESRNNT